MSLGWMVASILCLVGGVLAYGVAGARLHSGSRSDSGPLHSVDWWLGTGCQAAGFLLTLVSRRSLPVLIVQGTSSAGLAVTAVLQHVSGAQRLGRRSVLGIAGVVVGLGLVAVSTVPGPAVQIDSPLLWLLGICAVLCAAAMAVRGSAFLMGLASGLGYAFAAIGARLVVGDATHPLWIFWRLPAASWAVGLLTGLGIVLGQVHLTRGLARARAATVLAPMYLVETLLPFCVGPWLLGESPRPGTAVLMIVGVALALLGNAVLLRGGGQEA